MWLKAPEKCNTTCGFNGQVFTINAAGLVEVPEEATDLLNHGFTVATDEEIKKGSGKKAVTPIAPEEVPPAPETPKAG